MPISLSNFRKCWGVFAAICLVVLGSAFPSPADAQSAARGAAAQSPSGSRQATASVSSYRINAGDEIEIYVWGDERLQRDLTVLPDGTVSFPLAGQIHVAGMLPQDVEHLVTERLRAQYRDDVPYVTVSVKAPTGMRYSVLGKVRSPGVFNTSRYVNVLEALSQAGGPDEFANLDNVLIIRNAEDRTQILHARLGRLFRSGADEQDVDRAGIIRIEPGDVIIVP